MKPTQYFALTIGIIYLIMGVMGGSSTFIQPAAIDLDSTNMVVTAYSNLLGLFPVNSAHNVVHLLIGIVGIVASIALDSSRLYSGALSIFYGLLAVMGLVPIASSTFGLIPLFGNDVWLHAGTAAIAAYFGFIVKPDLLEISKVPSP
ncbi:MAG: DUF4383 domain-containing protein [Drouetiella hepatica Uher 2000/2452]|jgi:hypothetical protein|uniref:DUF4383 domain-containing protein n=1 Tax=Drouetiella hepatica Uher 2000/2452 TaxID=904376 RepID=A0A951US94_9CYAN|nr:DUF4383 domain-containing protein [Drouetiella hepatica Uher 2000/2452]